MQFVRVVLLCMGSAIGYGLVHDQITIRVCPEYFTIGHDPIFPEAPLTVIALLWGVIATWWMGLFLGVALAVAARAGRAPKRTAAELRRPIRKLLLTMAGAALLAGIGGYLAAKLGWVWLVEPYASEVPANRHVGFLADLWAHSASYAVGFWGGVVVCARVWRQRRRDARKQVVDQAA
jgi:hypothetical protein